MAAIMAILVRFRIGRADKLLVRDMRRQAYLRTFLLRPIAPCSGRRNLERGPDALR
jgi:hypothetical protein